MLFVVIKFIFNQKNCQNLYQHQIQIKFSFVSHKLFRFCDKKTANKNIYCFTELTQEQVNTLYAAWESIENSDVIAIQGIIDRINGLETMLYDPDFKFNNEYICKFSCFF